MMGKRMRDMWPGVHPAVKALRVAGLVVMGVVGAALFALVFGWLVMILWNWLMPAIFHLGLITYWQAFGIVILSKLIFGAAGGGRHGGEARRPVEGQPLGADRTATPGTTGGTIGTSGKKRAGTPLTGISSARKRKRPGNRGPSNRAAIRSPGAVNDDAQRMSKEGG